MVPVAMYGVHGNWYDVCTKYKVEIGAVNRVFVWRKVCEEWSPQCVAPPPRKRINIMIWGCITYFGVGTVDFAEGNINAKRYIDILEGNSWPVIAQHFPENSCIFQDDNAPVHRARSVVEYRLRNKIKTLTWSAQSPDLNIIENVSHRLQETRAKSTQNRAMRNLSVYAVNTAFWNSPPLGI